MEELQDLIKFLKDKGLEHHKINVDVLCGIIEYFAGKQEKQCAINVVSQQRELLLAFAEYMDSENDIFVPSWAVDNYLNSK